MILGTIGIALAALHAGQLLAGEFPLAGVVVFGAVAAWVVGWRTQVMRTVKTAVILLAALSLSCVVATLTVQRSQLEQASDEEFAGTVAFAWAHLLVKVTHPFAASPDLAASQEKRLETLSRVFGDDMADERREGLVKGMASAASEQLAHELAENHPATLQVAYRAAVGLRLTDVFRAWWFIGLFYLLCLNLLIGAIVRRSPSIRNLGFHGSHLGLIMVVAGATVGGFTGSRGFVPLEVGEPSDQFRSGTTGGPAPLGFAIRLDAFETLYHEDLVISTGDPAAAGAHHGMMGQTAGKEFSHTEKLEVGKVLELATEDGQGSFRVTMAEITAAAGLEQAMEATDDDAPPAALVRLDDGEPFWIGGEDATYVDPSDGFKIRVSPPTAAPASDGEGAGDAVCSDPEALGTLVMWSGEEEILSMAAAKGRTLSTASIEATIMEVYPDFKVGGRPPKPTDFPGNPAARVLISYNGEPPQPYLFFSSPELKSFTQLPWPGVQASFDFDFWCGPAGARIGIEVSETGASAAIIGDGDLPDERRDLTAGTTIPIPGTDRTLTFESSLARAAEQIRPIFTDADAAAEDAGVTALRLSVDDGNAVNDHWLLSNTVAGSLTLPSASGQELTLRLHDNRGRPPRDWISTLSALEEGEVVASGAAQVNEPFCYGGYCFFQSDANPDRPTYSGLQVVRDPAWPLVATGLWLLLLGISWCFYIQPLFDRRRAARSAAAKAGGDS